MNFTIDPNAVIGLLLVVLGGVALMARDWFVSRGKMIRLNTELEASRVAAEKQRIDQEKDAARRDADHAKSLAEINDKLTVTNKQLQDTTIALTSQIGELRGSLNTEMRVQEVLENRIQKAEEQKYEAYIKLGNAEREVEIALAAEVESAGALKKANEINQSYQATIREHQGTIDRLTDDMKKLNDRVTQLESDLQSQIATTDALRRDQALLRYALRRYAELVPLRSTTPEFQADFIAHGIDLSVLLADPLTIHEAPKGPEQQPVQEATISEGIARG